MVKQPQNVDCLEAALKANSLKQAAIANNIANLQTPGYRRSTVEFHQALAKAVESGEDPKSIKVQLIQPGTTPADATGNDVNLDMEVGEMIKNVMESKTYLRLMARAYRYVDLAIGGQ